MGAMTSRVSFSPNVSFERIWSNSYRLISSSLLAAYLSTVEQLHDDVHVLVVFLDRVQFDDVWVVNLLHDVDFILQGKFVLSIELSPVGNIKNQAAGLTLK